MDLHARWREVTQTPAYADRLWEIMNAACLEVGVTVRRVPHSSGDPSRLAYLYERESERHVARKALALAVMEIRGPESPIKCIKHSWSRVPSEQCELLRACDVARNPHLTCNKP